MDAYLARISRFPQLDAAHETSLGRRARDGDRAARDELITAHLSLVAARARQLGLFGPNLLDAVQAGSEGLIRAVDRFDPTCGSRLASYAWWWIADAMKIDTRQIAAGGLETVADDAVEDRYGQLHGVLDSLADDESDVIRARFGVGDPEGTGLTRSEAAERLGLTVAQVRRVERQAIARLRTRLAKVGCCAHE